jgi:hypothetical protein
MVGEIEIRSIVGGQAMPLRRRKDRERFRGGIGRLQVDAQRGQPRSTTALSAETHSSPIGCIGPDIQLHNVGSIGVVREGLVQTNEIQPRDLFKVAHIASGERISLLDRGDADQEIVDGQRNSLGRLLAADGSS